MSLAQGLCCGSIEDSLVSHYQENEPSKQRRYKRNSNREMGSSVRRTIQINEHTDSSLRGMADQWELSYGETVERIVNAWLSNNT